MMFWQMRFARAQFGLFMLLMMLQRLPVVKHLLQFERALAAPSSKAIQKLSVTTLAAGGLHGIAGATTFSTNPVSPATTTVGESFNLAFNISGTPEPARSWRILGDIPPGLTVSSGANTLQGNTLNGGVGAITGTPTTEGTFDFTLQAFSGLNLGGDTDGVARAFQIIVNAAPTPPEFSLNPQNTTVRTGGTAQFFFVTDEESPTIQWNKDGSPISGATGSTLRIENVEAGDAGNYSVTVSNTAGDTTSSVATLSINDASEATVSNLSNRGFVGTGGNVMIPGFVITGTRSKSMLVRAVGPKLADFGVSGVLEDPVLEVFDSGNNVIATNDDWETGNDVSEIQAAFGTLGAFDFDTGSKDAAILITLNPGAYTFKVSGVGGTTGVALIEVYNID